MGAIMDAINFNSYAYMGFILFLIGIIYLILFTIVKINIKN